MDREHFTAEELDILLTPSKQAAVSCNPTTPATPEIRKAETPDVLAAPAIAALRELHELFAIQFERSLGQQLQDKVQIRLADVAAQTYAHFVFGRPIPTCFAVIKASPIDATFILDLSPKILFPLLDRMLGSTEPAAPEQRPLTEIETRLVSRIVRDFLADYHTSWEHILSLDLRIDRFEHNPQQVRLFSGSEPTLFVRFEVRTGASHGYLDLCVPARAIQRMSSRLAAARQTDDELTKLQADSDLAMVSVAVTDLEFSVEELATLAVGDVIRTEIPVDGNLPVFVDGQPRFTAQLGTAGGKKLIVLEDEL